LVEAGVELHLKVAGETSCLLRKHRQRVVGATLTKSAALRAGARAVPHTEQKIFAATTSTLAEAGLW
jgi:hypothetical protein